MSSHSLCFLFFGNSGVSNKSKFHLKQVFHMMIAYSTVLNPYLNIFHLADLIFNLRFYRTLNFILSKCKNPKKNKRPIGHIIHLKNTSNFDLSKKTKFTKLLPVSVTMIIVQMPVHHTLGEKKIYKIYKNLFST